MKTGFIATYDLSTYQIRFHEPRPVVKETPMFYYFNKGRRKKKDECGVLHLSKIRYPYLFVYVTEEADDWTDMLRAEVVARLSFWFQDKASELVDSLRDLKNTAQEGNRLKEYLYERQTLCARRAFGISGETKVSKAWTPLKQEEIK